MHIVEGCKRVLALCRVELNGSGHAVVSLTDVGQGIFMEELVSYSQCITIIFQRCLAVFSFTCVCACTYAPVRERERDSNHIRGLCFCSETHEITMFASVIVWIIGRPLFEPSLDAHVIQYHGLDS